MPEAAILKEFDMKLVIPDSVQLGHNLYRIVFNDKLMQEEKSYGDVDYPERVINLAKFGVFPSSQKTLRSPYDIFEKLKQLPRVLLKI